MSDDEVGGMLDDDDEEVDVRNLHDLGAKGSSTSSSTSSSMTTHKGATRPRMLYTLEQSYALAQRSSTMEAYYHDQLAIACEDEDEDDNSGGGGVSCEQASGRSRNSADGQGNADTQNSKATRRSKQHGELEASLSLLLHPLPLTVRVNLSALTTSASSSSSPSPSTASSPLSLGLLTSLRESSAIALLASVLGETARRDGVEHQHQQRLRPIPWLPRHTGWQVYPMDSDDDNGGVGGSEGGDGGTGKGRKRREGKELRAVNADRVTETLIRLAKTGEVLQQEHGSLLSSLALLPVKSSMAVLDLCSAPGSKTLHLLDLLHTPEEEGGDQPSTQPEIRRSASRSLPSGLLVANEVERKRLCKVTARASSQPQTPLITTCCDARTFPSLTVACVQHRRDQDQDDGNNAATTTMTFPKLRFDRILCDVPCSGDGALRKMPTEVPRWHPRSGVAEHPRQLAILLRGLELLAPGGRLVYSTCSLNPIENEAVVAAAYAEANRRGLRVVLLDPPSPPFQPPPPPTPPTPPLASASSSTSSLSSSKSTAAASSLSSSSSSSSASSQRQQQQQQQQWCPRWSGWGSWGVPDPTTPLPPPMPYSPPVSSSSSSSSCPVNVAAAAAAAAISPAAAGDGDGDDTPQQPQPTQKRQCPLYRSWEEVPHHQRKYQRGQKEQKGQLKEQKEQESKLGAAGEKGREPSTDATPPSPSSSSSSSSSSKAVAAPTTKALLLESMFPPPGPGTGSGSWLRGELRRKCCRVMPSPEANTGGFFLAVFSRTTTWGDLPRDWMQVWSPPSPAAAVTAAAAAAGPATPTPTPTPTVAAAATSLPASLPAAAFFPHWKSKKQRFWTTKKTVSAPLNGLDDSVSLLSNEDAAEAPKTTGADKRKRGDGAAAGAHKSKRRNRETGVRVEVERRPWFLPLSETHPNALAQLETFFGLGVDNGGLGVDNVSFGAKSSGATTFDPRTQLATATFHKQAQPSDGKQSSEVLTVHVVSNALLALQQNKQVHVHSFGQPFARRMDAIADGDKEEEEDKAAEGGGGKKGGACASSSNNNSSSSSSITAVVA